MLKIYYLEDDAYGKEYKNCINYKSFVFNGGEIGFNFTDFHKIEACGVLTFEARVQSSNDLIELVSAVNALRQYNTDFWWAHLDLRLPYILGGRQDRISNPGETLSIKVYTDIINSVGFTTIETCDPHSDVTTALLNKCRLYPVWDIIRKVILDCRPDFIISPDAGATKRIETYLHKINCHLPVIQCLKKRDTKTGKLSGFEVCNWAEWSQPVSAKLLIIDDICDGGGTFLGLADEFKELNSKNELFLYITHGIFSKGYKDILEKYEKIYTTDAFIPLSKPTEEEQKKVIVYNLY